MIQINFKEKPSSLTISYTDDSFKNYKHFNKNYTNDNIKKSSLIVIVSTQSKINNLRFDITDGSIESITINPDIQFNLFKTINMTLLVLLIITFIYYLINNQTILDFQNFQHKLIG